MDTPEFTALLRRHAALIHKIACAYCRDVADREDLVQEIAVQLWRSRTRYDDRYRHTTWIYRIALNVAISFYRRERRHRDRTSEIDEHLLVVEPAAPSGEIQRLLGCIAELGPLDRALVLLYLEGNDHGAIGEVLGISTSNVGTKLGRIRSKLREALDRPAHASHGKDRHGAG
jgi:RNA polymerase sigma-70 factor, ECF subfamily